MPRFATRSGLRRFSVLAVAFAVGSVLLAVGTVSGQKRDDLRQYLFTVEIDGLPAGMFRHVEGIGVETEVVEFREGGSNDFVHKLPGRGKWPNLVLKRGFLGDPSLLDWAMAAANGNAVRKTVSIAMLDQAGAPIARWRFERAWPAKWTGPELDASKNEVAIETLEIAHEGMTMARE
jgi:phage tail-like protein